MDRSEGVGCVTETALPQGGSLGAALRAAREAAGLSVEQVSATTRIRGTLIRDLESDRFESSGAPVYARGHVRAITHAIGIDEAPYVALFAKQVGGIDGPFPVPTPQPVLPAARGPLAPPEPLHVPTAARPERRGPNWLAAGSAALGVLVVLFAVGQLSKPGGAVTDPPVGAASSAVATAPAKAPGPAKNLTAQRPVAVGAELRVRVLGGDSWVSVRNAATTLFEGVLRDGAIKDFKDVKQLRLIVGNAGAVSIVCSGRDLGPAGGQGKVRRFTCNADGIVPA
ncbi:MAG: helix-turn-helix domain-containing protein [Mycobacteriales bacterium]